MLCKFSTRILLLLLIIGCFSCDGKTSVSESEDHSDLKEEVIAIHDEVMPQMGRLKNMEKRVTSQKDSLVALDSAGHSEEIAHKASIVDELNQAYDGMFVWMRQFRPDDIESEEEETYLLEQREKVQEVNRQIKEALARAEAEVGS
ncbi:hypothetical protein KI659_13070 [Litoribacter alkaliphilus]|uniref:Viral A-type inclusion protein n=1 Tax=Litoribacter ruber TaxID=702568 RepID=A0AAP2G1N7_9BACT|nr:hypothetical protein [Litoribacter alkaliphilus]MBS9524944.1 hypothetical protein [Litoribacter alkaliphilus]